MNQAHDPHGHRLAGIPTNSPPGNGESPAERGGGRPEPPPPPRPSPPAALRATSPVLGGGAAGRPAESSSALPPGTGGALRSGEGGNRAGTTRGARILTLLTDAYGGRGGIAQHNRHLLEALCSTPGVEEVVALPRVVVEDPGPLPDRLTYRTDAAAGKAAYLRTLSSFALRPSPFDVVVSGHLNLLPLAALLAARHRARLVQVVHGIEAWPDPGPLKRALVRRVDTLVSVSDFTRRKVLAWAGLPEARTAVIPNAIDLAAYGPGPTRPDLLARYRLEGRKVILTLGRLSAAERYKGHDEILDVLPDLARDLPAVAYLVVGDGDDRPRLEEKARALGLAGRVVFAGYVPEGEKLDHYRLADVFAMPGRGEGFGIAYLEALACGVPVVASSADASREAVRDGLLGAVVDPADPAALRRVLREALNGRRDTFNVTRSTPEGLAYFSTDRFRRRWHEALAPSPRYTFDAKRVRGHV